MATKQTNEPQQKTQKKTKVLRVRTARNVPSFWRAGLRFGPEPRDVPLADLTDEQRKAIEAEPMLMSEVVEV